MEKRTKIRRYGVRETIPPPSEWSSTGCYKGWQELSHSFKFAEFTLTIDDAKEYVYSLSTSRRVYNWNDIKVSLYI